MEDIEEVDQGQVEDDFQVEEGVDSLDEVEDIGEIEINLVAVQEERVMVLEKEIEENSS